MIRPFTTLAVLAAACAAPSVAPADAAGPGDVEPAPGTLNVCATVIYCRTGGCAALPDPAALRSP